MFADVKLTGRVGFGVILVVVVAAYAQVFFFLRGPWLTWNNAFFVALGLLFLLPPIWCGLPGAKWAGTLAGRLLYFAIQLPLATLILFLSPVKGNISLLVFPLVSQAVFMVPPVLVGLFSGLLYLMSIAPLAALYGWRDAVAGSIGLVAAFVFTIAFSYVARREAREREVAQALSTRLEEANQKLHAAAAQAEELAVARERNRLAREIHDGLGHYLTTVAVQLEAARALLAEHPARAAAALEKATQLTQDALADVRRSVGALRVDAARVPLVRQLEQLAAADPGLTVELTVQGTVRTLEPAIEHALFRVVQEGLTNVRKHAGTAAARATLDFREPARVRLEVADRGRGAPAGAGAAGFGLNGVRERIELVGGRMATAAGPAGGFVLTVEVPG